MIKISACKQLLYSLMVLVCVFSQYTTQAQMRQVFVDAQVPANAIRKISFYNRAQGYAAFSNWIGYTTDSGHTFLKKQIGNSNVDFNGYSVNITFGFDLQGVSAFSKDTLIAYGNYGFVPAILYSVNAGNNFKLVFHSQYNGLQQTNGIEEVLFPENNSTGYAIDADRILKSTDKGLSWAVIRIDPSSYFKHLDATDNNNVFAFSTDYNNSRLLKTSNAGSNWQQITVPLFTGSNIQYADFITPLKGWINIIDGLGTQKLFYTSTAGASWQQKNNTEATAFVCTKMTFINDSTGFATTGLYDVIKTTDSGKVWEAIPRDNAFSYLGYTHNDLQVWNEAQLWAGGGHGFLELNTNGTAATLPQSYFWIDTTGSWQNGIVKLVNYSKPGYTYSWYVNNTLKGSSYQLSYTHQQQSQVDSVTLIVTKGALSDTLTRYQYFIVPNLPVINSFAPATGSTGTALIINGSNLSNVTSVHAGGIPVASFTIVNDNTITAVIANAGTGNITVADVHGSFSLPGFTYFAPPVSPPPFINAIFPVAGNLGSTVTLSGNNFNPSAAGNIVYFGDTRALVTTATATQIVCIVPIGASCKPISVLNTSNGLFAHSSMRFNVTFADSSNFTSRSFSLAHTISFGVNTTPYFGLTKDIDGDGKTDLVSSFLTSRDSLAVFRNTTNGSSIAFGAASNIGTASGKFSIEDVDGDGKADIVTATNSASVNVFRNTSSPGIISFKAKVSVPCAVGSQDIAIADMDNDGKNDLAIGSFGNGGGVSVVRNTSSPGFLSFGTSVNYIAGGFVKGIAAGDLDGDGKKDIVTINYANLSPNSTFSFFRNTGTTGNLSFSARIDIAVPGVVSEGHDIAIADMDNDGKADVVVINDNNFYCIFRNISSPGTIAFAPIVNYPSTGIAKSGNIANLSGNAKPDILCGNWTYNAFYLFKNSSTPSAVNFETPITGGTSGTYNATTADINGDGKTDFISTNAGYRSITIYSNRMGEAVPFSTCEGISASINTDVGGSNYQWQQDSGTGFTNLSNNPNIADVNATALQFINTPFSLNNYRYRCLADGKLSSVFVLTVNPRPQPLVAVSASDTAICYGSPITFTATPTNGCASPTYTWQVNGITKGSNAASFYSSTLNNNDQVRVILASSIACSVLLRDTSSPIIIKVTGLAPAVGIATTNTQVCAGDSITFTATPVNGGNNPLFQWQINGVNTGSPTLGNTFTFVASTSHQWVSALLTSDPVCGPPVQVKANNIYISVSQLRTPDVAIRIVNTLDTLFCEGTNITLFASANYGGNAPVYQWKVNGNNAGISNAFFNSTTFKNNDFITLTLTSSFACTITKTANSNGITLRIKPPVTPSIIISGNSTVTMGAATAVSATVTNGGATAVYAWQDSTAAHGWQNIAGAISNAFNYIPLQTGDAIRCRLASSENCVTNASVVSNYLSFTVNTITGINTLPASNYGVHYFPNPANAVLYLEGLSLSDNWQTLEITSIDGKENLLVKDIQGLQKLAINIQHFRNGYYNVILKRKKGVLAYFRFIKQL